MCGMIDCSECFSWAPVAATYGVEQISVLKISLFKLFIIINFFSWIIYNPSDLRDISIQMVSQTTNWSAALLALDAHLIFLASHLNTEGWKQPCFSREEINIWSADLWEKSQQRVWGKLNWNLWENICEIGSCKLKQRAWQKHWTKPWSPLCSEEEPAVNAIFTLR